MTDDTEIAPDATPPLSEWKTLDALRTQLEAELFSLNKGVLFDALASAGVTHVVVTFDGYGDSGQIENVEVRSGDHAIPMPEGTIEIAQAVWGQSEPERSIVAIATAIESLAYDALERTHRGWENSDGAYGDITFDVAAHAITLDYNERYTAAENYTHQF
ncbi:DUF6878 family protein [Paracoccus pantotrophus]|uniref:DUF6878 family protein n=1 Tax=Paracoccus pantotrophus TaxID=82367 RepID=UPI00048FFA2A|nr:DUF6878 family protein [Paracoccus pantotrophus]